MLAAHAAFMTGVGLPPPTITGISPTGIYTSRWVTFTITGTNFVQGATTVTAGASSVTNVNVNTAGTSLTVQIYAYSAGSFVVAVTTPFGTAYSQSISASVEPPLITVSSTLRSNDGVSFNSSATAVFVYGNNFSSSIQVYASPTGGTSGYKNIGYYGTTSFFFQSGTAAGGQFFISDPSTGGSTGWITYS